MAALRTQIYLTQAQRDRLDAIGRREGRPLAQLIRQAVDRFLDDPPAKHAALAETFGAAPDFSAPSREDWDERDRRIWSR